jgi:hypothetical protein
MPLNPLRPTNHMTQIGRSLISLIVGDNTCCCAPTNSPGMTQTVNLGRVRTDKLVYPHIQDHIKPSFCRRPEAKILNGRRYRRDKPSLGRSNNTSYIAMPFNPLRPTNPMTQIGRSLI